MKRRLTQVASVAVLILALALVPAAVAGKGKGQGPGNNAYDPTLSSDCNPCALGTFAHFSGSGYDGSQPTALIAFRRYEDGSITQMQAGVNPDGTLAFEVYVAPVGTYDVMVLQNDHNKTVLMGTLQGLVIH